MKSTFQEACEAAAGRWAVPALVAGTSVAGRERIVAVGCDPETRFRIASITKPMTATLVLSLLDPDEPTGVWPADVRVRHLLAHTSGYDGELPGRPHGKHGDGDDALARCVSELPGIRRWLGADHVWSYANSGYWLAAHLAAERAGSTYEDALAERVLAPAGLEATAFDEPDVAGSDHAPYPRSRRPSGGLVSNVADLLRFGRAHLADDRAPAMRVVAGKPVGGVYGLGLFGERVGGVDVWGHTGSYGGFQSHLLTIPSHGAVFAGLTNSELGRKALDEIEDAWFEELLGARRASPRYVKPDPGELDRYAGTYGNSDLTVEVEAAGDGLVLHVDGEEIVGLKIRDRTFCVPVGDHVNERFDFPVDGFGRFGSRLAERG